MSTDKDVKITYVDVQEDSSSKSTDYSISKSNIPQSYSKILVPDDGKEISDKALNFAISLSNLSGAEIVILRRLKSLFSEARKIISKIDTPVLLVQ